MRHICVSHGLVRITCPWRHFQISREANELLKCQGRPASAKGTSNLPNHQQTLQNVNKQLSLQDVTTQLIFEM